MGKEIKPPRSNGECSRSGATNIKIKSPEAFCGVGENRHRVQVLRVGRLRAIAYR